MLLNSRVTGPLCAHRVILCRISNTLRPSARFLCTQFSTGFIPLRQQLKAPSLRANTHAVTAFREFRNATSARRCADSDRAAPAPLRHLLTGQLCRRVVPSALLRRCASLHSSPGSGGPPPWRRASRSLPRGCSEALTGTLWTPRLCPVGHKGLSLPPPPPPRVPEEHGVFYAAAFSGPRGGRGGDCPQNLNPRSKRVRPGACEPPRTDSGSGPRPGSSRRLLLTRSLASAHPEKAPSLHETPRGWPGRQPRSDPRRNTGGGNKKRWWTLWKHVTE